MNYRIVLGTAVTSYALLYATAIAGPPVLHGGVVPVATATPKAMIHTIGVPPVATPPPVYVAAPQNVATTTSIEECSSHAVSFACMLAMKSAYYVPFWVWSNAQCQHSDQCRAGVDGYHVYQNYKLLDSAPTDQTALAFDPKHVGTPCFSLTAYRASETEYTNDISVLLQYVSQ